MSDRQALKTTLIISAVLLALAVLSLTLAAKHRREAGLYVQSSGQICEIYKVTDPKSGRQIDRASVRYRVGNDVYTSELPEFKYSYKVGQAVDIFYSSEDPSVLLSYLYSRENRMKTASMWSILGWMAVLAAVVVQAVRIILVRDRRKRSREDNIINIEDRRQQDRK